MDWVLGILASQVGLDVQRNVEALIWPDDGETWDGVVACGSFSV